MLYLRAPGSDGLTLFKELPKFKRPLHEITPSTARHAVPGVVTTAVFNAIDSEEAAATAAVAVEAAAVDDEALVLRGQERQRLAAAARSATQLLEAPRRGRLAQPCLFRMLCRHAVPTLGLAVPVVRRSRGGRECEPGVACTQKQRRGTTAGGDGGWHTTYLRFLSAVLSIVSVGGVGIASGMVLSGEESISDLYIYLMMVDEECKQKEVFDLILCVFQELNNNWFKLKAR